MSNPPARTEIPSSELLALISNWKQIAQRKFIDAGKASGMEARFIEHGAMCYFNAANELEELLKLHQAAAEPLP
jgi:hypothetical protein